MTRSGEGQRELLRTLRERGLLDDPRVEAAMEAVPRHAFVPPDLQGDAHVDAPLPIGGGQTISAPHMVAIMAAAVDARPGHRVLEVGGGSGYHAALLAHLVQPGGRVVSMEVRPELAAAARANLARLPAPPPIDVVVGDGSRGFPERAPFDRISVACGAPDVPAPLLEQLADDGVLVIPVGGYETQELLRVRKDGARESLGPVRFVPLVGEFGFSPTRTD